MPVIPSFILFLLVGCCVSASSSGETSVENANRPGKAFLWDLNESYKQSESNESDHENGEEHTSNRQSTAASGWGGKKGRTKRTRTKKEFHENEKIELPSNHPKKARTLSSRPKMLKIPQDDTFSSQETLKRSVKKADIDKKKEKKTCKPHIPGCEHWDTLSLKQQQKEKRKMRYYLGVSEFDFSFK